MFSFPRGNKTLLSLGELRKKIGIELAPTQVSNIDAAYAGGERGTLALTYTLRVSFCPMKLGKCTQTSLKE